MKLNALASAGLMAFSLVAAAPALAQSFQVIGGNTSASPTYNRTLEDLSDLSAVGTAVHYDTYTFTAMVSGDYIFNTTAAFDSMVFLYQGSFNPNDALSNGVIGNDDIIFGNSFFASGFEVALTAGSTYVYVTTGFDLPDAGAYSTTIAGPAAVMAVPVPEVGTYAMMALGLAGLGLNGWRRRQREAA